MSFGVENIYVLCLFVCLPICLIAFLSSPNWIAVLGFFSRYRLISAGMEWETLRNFIEHLHNELWMHTIINKAHWPKSVWTIGFSLSPSQLSIFVAVLVDFSIHCMSVQFKILWSTSHSERKSILKSSSVAVIFTSLCG